MWALAATVAFVAATLTGSAVPATPATPAAPATGATFNKPTGSAAEQYAIRDHVLGLLKATEAGTTVTTSIYNITDDERGVADELVAASQRGVKVRVILESEHASTGSARAIVAGLGTDKTKPSWAVVCSSGCHGTKINHNKFYLFSSVEGQSNVVVQSSANLTISNSRTFWNNAVTIVGNAELYNAYLTYFTDMSRNVNDADYYKTFSAGEVKTYHFPRAGTSSSTDTVYNALGNVNCSGGGTIRVGMWYFGRTAVAQRLASLAGSGCKVDVVYTDITDGPLGALNGKPNVRLRELDDGTYIIHSKYMLIDATYADARRKVVFTGSANFSDAALRLNDESMLRIYNDAIHDQYAANFTDAWNAAG